MSGHPEATLHKCSVCGSSPVCHTSSPVSGISRFTAGRQRRRIGHLEGDRRLAGRHVSQSRSILPGYSRTAPISSPMAAPLPLQQLQIRAPVAEPRFDTVALDGQLLDLTLSP